MKRHHGKRHCWLRGRLHRMRPTWLNGERVGYDGMSVYYGCIECGRRPS